MFERVFKYPLPIHGSVHSLPTGAKLVSIGAQGNDIFMWLRVNPVAPERVYEFYVAGTGWELPPEACQHVLGSVHLTNGEVYHVFSVGAL